MRLIDADDVLDSIENWKRKVLYYHPYTKKFSTIPLSEVMSFLEDSPTIDAVPVVRCKDCKHKGGFGCPWWKGEDIPNDWYCAGGERRDDE